MRLTHDTIKNARRVLCGSTDFLGQPDAERDSEQASWSDSLVVHPAWFTTATDPRTTVTIGRKGTGKTAIRIISSRAKEEEPDALSISISADELAHQHRDLIDKAVHQGYGATSTWCQIYADVVVRHVATRLKGQLLTDEDLVALRKWATTQGIGERDFVERLGLILGNLVPWCKKALSADIAHSDENLARLHRIAQKVSFSLLVDDFDNIQEQPGYVTNRLIRDAIEAADRITSRNTRASVRLFMRQDLWLRIRPGWAYADKVSRTTELNWTSDDLQRWVDRRLRAAVATVVGCNPKDLEDSFDTLWGIFFPEELRLDNGDTSPSFQYILRRTMYTPRSISRFLSLILDKASTLPVRNQLVTEAEERFSRDQLSFLQTEFEGICKGLNIGTQAFTRKTGPMVTSELLKILRPLLGTGQVRLLEGASDGAGPIALARFLFRIGFLEVRYPEFERYEVRDAMRHPEHWNAIREDDSINWAVRSAFYRPLRGHGP